MAKRREFQCCGTCAYGKENSPGVISCFRYPPTITKAEGTTVTSYFPLLLDTAWCGEWRSHTNARGVGIARGLNR